MARLKLSVSEFPRVASAEPITEPDQRFCFALPGAAAVAGDVVVDGAAALVVACAGSGVVIVIEIRKVIRIRRRAIALVYSRVGVVVETSEDSCGSGAC